MLNIWSNQIYYGNSVPTGVESCVEHRFGIVKKDGFGLLPFVTFGVKV